MALIACLIFLSVLASSHGHICLISPHQRGSMKGLDNAGATDCILLNGPCGGRVASQDSNLLYAGQNFTVIWQKNLDHFYKANPGYFSIAIGHNESSLKTLYNGTDTSASSLTLYSVDVTMPNMVGKMVLQAQYVTQNPKAPAVFFQCSDITLIPRM